MISGAGTSRASLSGRPPIRREREQSRNTSAQRRNVTATENIPPQALEPPKDPGTCPRLKGRSIKGIIFYQGVKILSGVVAMFSIYNLCYYFNQYYLKSFADDPHKKSQEPENLAFLYAVSVMCGLSVWLVRQKIVKGVGRLFSLSNSQRNKAFNAELREHAVKLAQFVRDNERYVRQREAAHEKMLSFRLDYTKTEKRN